MEPPDRVRKIGHLMHVDGITAEVVRELRLRGVRPILLKGPGLGRWIYPDRTHRLYSDTDLLVDRGDLPVVEATLGDLGFVLAVPRHELDRPVPSANWFRPEGGAAVDVHVSITGIGVPDRAAWERLSRDTETLQVGGLEVEVPSRAARALHIALHAAQHGVMERRPLQDLEVGLEVVPETVWREAAALAGELGATEAFGAGLRLDPRGEALSERLGLPSPRAVDVLLRKATAPPLALSIHWLTEMPGLWPKIRLVAAKIFPPPAEMRARARLRRRAGAGGLVVEYLRNVLALALQVPPALRAVRRARSEARNARARRNPGPDG